MTRIPRPHLPSGLAVGLRRVRDTFWPVVWAALACGTAYLVAARLVGHPYPFYAAVAAFSALGVSPDVRPRRVGEVAIGVTVGVGLGGLAQYWVGSGPVQVAVVVVVAASIARLLDPSPVLTAQSTVQAIVVLGLPAMAATGGPVGRWLDALAGGAVALLFSLFIPKDPRRRPRTLARDVLTDLAVILDRLAQSLRTGDVEQARSALTRGRSTQRSLSALTEAVSAAGSTARLSPAWRRHKTELEWLADSAEHTDRAVRTARVLARRVVAADGLVDEEIAGRCEALAAGSARLAETFARGHDPAAAQDLLARSASVLVIAGETDPMRHTLTSLLRSVAFDLECAAGMSESDAARPLRS